MSTLAEVFNCPICLEQMKEPTSLKCGHLFCYACLEKLRDESPAVNHYCPLCKKPISCLLDELPRIFAVKDAIKALESHKNDVCLVGTTSNEHEVFSTTVCVKHDPETASLACKQCRTLICHDCVMPNHNNHFIVPRVLYEQELALRLLSVTVESEHFKNSLQEDIAETKKLLSLMKYAEVLLKSAIADQKGMSDKFRNINSPLLEEWSKRTNPKDLDMFNKVRELYVSSNRDPISKIRLTNIPIVPDLSFRRQLCVRIDAIHGLAHGRCYFSDSTTILGTDFKLEVAVDTFNDEKILKFWLSMASEKWQDLCECRFSEQSYHLLSTNPSKRLIGLPCMLPLVKLGTRILGWKLDYLSSLKTTIVIKHNFTVSLTPPTSS